MISEIEYTLSEADFLALARFRAQQWRGRRNPVLVRQIAYGGGFILIAAGALLTQQVVLAAIMLGMAILAVALYPSYFDWLLRRRVSTAYHDPKNAAAKAPFKLTAGDDGLEEQSSMGEAKIKWDVVTDLTYTPTHAYIWIRQTPHLVIASERVSQGDLKDFVSACRKHITITPTV